MNQKVYIKQDGTIPGHRIIEELKKRGGINLHGATGNSNHPTFYFIDKDIKIDWGDEISEGYTELFYNKETDSFYEKSQEEALLNKLVRFDITQEGNDKSVIVIPEGYEARIEDGKVIISKKQWEPKERETFYYLENVGFLEFEVQSADWKCRVYTDGEPDKEETDRWANECDYLLERHNVFHTKVEAQAFYDKLNAAIAPILEERRNNG